MENIQQIIERLDEIEKLYGITGVILAIIIIIGFILIWKYLIRTIDNQAKITFDKKMADYNKEIQEELANLNDELNYLTTQKLGNIDKEREAIINYLDAYNYWDGRLELFNEVMNKDDYFQDVASVITAKFL